MLTTKNPHGFRPLPPDTRKSHKSFVRAAGSFVPKLTAKAFERYGFHSAEIMTAWDRVAGPDLAQYTEPERIKWPRLPAGAEPANDDRGRAQGAILVIRVDPARALEVEYQAAALVDRINRYFGYGAISGLRVVQSPVRRAELAEPADNPAVRAPAPPELAAVTEPGLKSALGALWDSITGERARR
jgi:hypothetical protein